ncbi:unnamed protein product, partial [Rotaria sordida]
AAVCHHGGAGTTAAGLRAGKPTIIVPFFGDQFFWGSVISKSGAGPPPVPGKRLNIHDLTEAFKIAHESDTREAAYKLSVAFQHENGCENAVRSFHANLPLSKMYSDLESSFSACFRLNDYNLQISRPVAQVLVAAEAIKESQLTLLATRDWSTSMYDDRPHILMHGFLKHGHKALQNLFIDTPQGLRKAANSTSITTGTLDGTECIIKGIGRSIGHVYVGCLSFYGEITDVLEYLPELYDPYSDSDKRKRPQIKNFSSGAKAAELSIWHGFKDGITGIVTKPRTGYKRHGILGGAAGAAAAIPNIVIKPTVGTLASLTWLGRGIYAGTRRLSRNKRANSNNQLTVLNTPRSKRALSESRILIDNTSPEGCASLKSGLRIDICKKILHDFERIKNRYTSKNANENSKETKKTKSKKIFQRQRSHSATHH